MQSSTNINKVNVILDTDTCNEFDDCFAITYLLKNTDIFNIEAITIAPFSHPNRNITVSEGQELSYIETIKICKWLNFNTTNKVFKGAMDYIQNGYNQDNPAVDAIIKIALKNKKTYILGIGAITNIALALQKEPEIASKIEIIWLGGNELGYVNNLEYNFRQDIKAVKLVFNSKVKLTILPCKNVVAKLKININTLKKHIANKSELNDYLIKKFNNDGYHGIQEESIIWDIAVIAFMINKDWFKSAEVSCPQINDDTSYSLTNNLHKIKMITDIDRDEIYKDLFKKLGDSNEINK